MIFCQLVVAQNCTTIWHLGELILKKLPPIDRWNINDGMNLSPQRLVIASTRTQVIDRDSDESSASVRPFFQSQWEGLGRILEHAHQVAKYFAAPRIIRRQQVVLNLKEEDYWGSVITQVKQITYRFFGRNASFRAEFRDQLLKSFSLDNVNRDQVGDQEI